ncbi:hypothetical protein DFA_00231 [Cavenderia fasciculata]|uniref:Uncharacterized protein n=1 Tax=Cavenderia fasciculata TaxID=261658 RepID=F4PXZ3_CACFS|nr:uncharacterized protein DFA_00231 [Cavenderia fasciculata]EGG19653.1 hypothetical protein DFA_00231 [Cavenderia fasciculata]|eukprot:XP_004357947.1 hypothetical protein DFA_00231 [Cavenderia fasciculata]
MKKNCKKIKAKLRNADLARERQADRIIQEKKEKIEKKRSKEAEKKKQQDRMIFDEVENEGNQRGRKRVRRAPTQMDEKDD